MAEVDYSHRDVLDKLGIKPGHAVALADEGFPIDPLLSERILDRLGRDLGDSEEPLDVVLAGVTDASDPVAVLARWKPRLAPNGGIWLLSPKRKQPGYVDQTLLIAAGAEAGLVDNKVCSVSDTTSAMRFVIRKQDRKK